MMSVDINPVTCNVFKHGDALLEKSEKKNKNVCTEVVYGFHKQFEYQNYELSELENQMGNAHAVIGWMSLLLGKFINSRDVTFAKLVAGLASGEKGTIASGGPWSVEVKDVLTDDVGCDALYAALGNNEALLKVKDVVGCLTGIEKKYELNLFWADKIDKLLGFAAFSITVANFGMGIEKLKRLSDRVDTISLDKCKYSFSPPNINLFLCNRNYNAGSGVLLRCLLPYKVDEGIGTLYAQKQTGGWGQDKSTVDFGIFASHGIEFVKKGGISDLVAGTMVTKLTDVLIRLFTESKIDGDGCSNVGAGSSVNIINGISLSTVNGACTVIKTAFSSDEMHAKMVDADGGLLRDCRTTRFSSSPCLKYSSFSYDQSTGLDINGGGLGMDLPDNVGSFDSNDGVHYYLDVHGVANCLLLHADDFYVAFSRALPFNNENVCFINGLVLPIDSFCGIM